MSDNYISIIPKTDDYPNRMAKAKEILDWLISRDIVKDKKTDSILGSDSGYSVSNGAKSVVDNPEDLPFDLWINGLEIITKKEVFHPGQFYEGDDGSELPKTNLGFTFWNWPEFKNEFLLEFKAQLGMEIDVIVGRL